MYNLELEKINLLRSSSTQITNHRITINSDIYTMTDLKQNPSITHISDRMFGSFPMKEIEFEIWNREGTLELENKECFYEIGKKINEIWEWIPIGKFIITEITTDESSKSIRVKGKDYTHKFITKYEDTLSWDTNHTGLEIINNVCNAVGVELEGDFSFKDYEFSQPNYVENISAREAIARMAEIGGEIAVINRVGKLIFTKPFETNQILTKGHRLSYILENETQPINKISLGYEGIDNDFIYGDGDNIYRIEDNPFCDLDRATIAPNIFENLIGSKITPFEVEGFIDDCIFDINDILILERNDGTTQKIRILEIKNNGTFRSDIKASKEEDKTANYLIAGTTKESIQKVKLEVNHIDQKITAQAEKTDELESQISEVTQTAEGLTATVTENITDLQEKIAELGLTQEELELIFKLQNGNNLIRNSVMKNGTSFWFKEIEDMYISSQQPENPYNGQYWFNEEDSEEFKRNQLYQYNEAENRWIESTKSKSDLMSTGVEGFTQSENQESRENSISNSIILMDAGNNILEKTHLFGITEGISIPTDTEMISLGLKVKNQIRTGNIYVAFGFAPVEPANMVSSDEEGYLLYGIKEDWHKITPDDNTSWSKVERHLKVPKTEDLKAGHKGTTAPEDTNLIWLDDGNKSYGKFPIAKYYNEEAESWELCEDCPPILIDNRIYTYREFYGGYYKTIYSKDDFKANYLFVALTCYPSANYETGPELPETATDRDSYFGILGSADTSHDIIYRAKFRDGEFESWVPTYIPSLLPLNPELQAMIPSPPFPTNTIIPVSGQFYFTDLKAESGMLCTAWSPHVEETYTTSYKSDSSGQKIISGENTMLMSDEEILATKGTEEVFRISGDLTKFKYIEALKAKLSGLNIQKTKIGNTDTIIMF